MLSASMMLTWLGTKNDDDVAKQAASHVDEAVGRVLENRASHTADVGGKAKTAQVGDAVASEI